MLHKTKVAVDAVQDQPDSSEKSSTKGDERGFDLMLYGNELILRGSDNGTLVAFAAIAFQEIRRVNAPHHDVASGFLLFAVVMAAVVHFSLGSAYVSRARQLISGKSNKRKRINLQRIHIIVAWIAGITQFVCVFLGAILVLSHKPPAFLQQYLLDYLM